MTIISKPLTRIDGHGDVVRADAPVRLVVADGLVLNDGQRQALREILAANHPGRQHLLTGYAGAGKTTLMEFVARAMLERGFKIAMTAPTHKAASVLRRRMKAAALDIPCLTVHSLLSLEPRNRGDRKIFVRGWNAKPIEFDVIVVDECSMCAHDIMCHIDECTPNAFVLFVGDPAQIPPINERVSRSFNLVGDARSHLSEVVRQAADNPIIAAAQIIRKSIGGDLDWSWAKQVRVGNIGIFTPPDAEVDRWLKRAFTSAEFEADPDTFRYLCYHNSRAAEVNTKIREWIYGENLPTPFVRGECALIRAPITTQGIDEAGNATRVVLFNSNDEAVVDRIEPGNLTVRFNDVLDDRDEQYARKVKLCQARGWPMPEPPAVLIEGWAVEVETWRIHLRTGPDTTVAVHTVRDKEMYAAAERQLRREARHDPRRWDDWHRLEDSFAKLQSIYAMTIHTAQGSTFRHVFVDVRDISARIRRNKKEAQQLFYVAATRPTHTLVLVGA